MEYIQEIIKPIGTALGVKYGKSKVKKSSNVLPDDLPVESVLAMIGGKGIKVQRNG